MNTSPSNNAYKCLYPVCVQIAHSHLSIPVKAESVPITGMTVNKERD